MTKAHTEILNDWLLEIQDGSTRARADVIDHTCERLRLLARKMLRGFPKVGRWSQTDDVLQNSLLRLHRSLEEVKPDSASQFYGLAATQIRRELLDLARKFQGAEGIGANHNTDKEEIHIRGIEGAGFQPESLEAWTIFHNEVEALDPILREVVSLLWYDGFTQPVAAELLEISLATLKRRWQTARLSLFDRLKNVDFQ